MSEKKQINISEIVHLCIGLGMMFFGRMLPAPSLVVEASDKLINMGFPQVDGGLLIAITPVGMTVVTLSSVLFIYGLQLTPCGQVFLGY